MQSSEEQEQLKAELSKNIDTKNIKSKEDFKETLNDTKTKVEEALGESLSEVDLEDIEEDAQAANQTEANSTIKETINNTPTKKQNNAVVSVPNKTANNSNTNNNKPTNNSNNKPSTPAKKPNNPSKPSKPNKPSGHWETRTKKVKVGEKKVIDKEGHSIPPVTLGECFQCGCGWCTSLYDATKNPDWIEYINYFHKGVVTKAEAQKQWEDHMKATGHGSNESHYGRWYSTMYGPEWVEGKEEKYHMEPMYETRTEKVWVED